MKHIYDNLSMGMALVMRQFYGNLSKKVGLYPLKIDRPRHEFDLHYGIVNTIRSPSNKLFGISYNNIGRWETRTPSHPFYE